MGEGGREGWERKERGEKKEKRRDIFCSVLSSHEVTWHFRLGSTPSELQRKLWHWEEEEEEMEKDGMGC